MSDILDRGSLLFGSIAVILVSLLLEFSLRGAASFSLAFIPLIALAVVYVPGTLLLTNLLAHLGGFSVVFQRDYSALLTCAAMAWTAVNIPIAAAGWLLPLTMVGAIAILACLYFMMLMFFAVRTVFGTESRIAADPTAAASGCANPARRADWAQQGGSGALALLSPAASQRITRHRPAAPGSC